MNEQHSLGWYRDRLGRITGSAVGKIIGKGRSVEFTDSGMSYLASVAAERLLSPEIVGDDDNFALYIDEVNTTSKAMRIGNERECDARQLYCDIRDVNVDEIGCMPHPTIPGFASSPDGLVAPEGCIEIKCPTPETYMKYISRVHSADDLQRMNADYYWQCFAHMSVTGARWCDFIVYNPYFCRPIHIVRIDRDEAVIAELENRTRLALAHVDEIIAAATTPPG